MNPIRILIADDHALFREGIRALLLATPDIDCIGEAANGQEVLELVETLKPDVVLMDISMPGLTGIEATQRILAANPATGVIMVTMLEDDTSLYRAMRAGVRGYVLKGANHQEMLDTIRAVAEGKALYGSDIAGRVTRFFQSQHTQALAKPFPDLTNREHEVLDLIAQGKSNSDIAGELFISPKTVRNHITSIFDKLDVADRAEAIIKARDAGYGKK